MTRSQPDSTQATTTDEVNSHSFRAIGPAEEPETEAHNRVHGAPTEAPETEVHYVKIAQVDEPATGGSLMKRLLAVTAVLALGLLMSASASASSWRLHVSPAVVKPGGSVRVRTTSHARVCALTVRLHGRRYRFRLYRRGMMLTIGSDMTAGRASVTAVCGNYIAQSSFSIVVPPSAPTTTAPTTAPTTTAPTTTAPPTTTTPPVTTPTPTPQMTPVTVANVCALSPGLGPHTDIGPPAVQWPTAVWTYANNAISFLAISDNGTGVVDLAIIPSTTDPDQIAYIARCGWSEWLSVAQYAQYEEQQGVPATQASSLDYLDETVPTPTDLAAEWFQPAEGWSQCAGQAFEECDYEPVDDDDDDVIPHTPLARQPAPHLRDVEEVSGSAESAQKMSSRHDRGAAASLEPWVIAMARFRHQAELVRAARTGTVRIRPSATASGR